MSLHDLLKTVADDVMFDVECAAQAAAYCIRRPNGDDCQFHIKFLEDDDDSIRHRGNQTQDRQRIVVGWVPTTYATPAGTTLPMPVPDDNHFLRPAGESVWFTFTAIHERNAAGYLCSFKRSDLRSVGGFDSARR